MEYSIISCDSHIDVTWMPGDLWLKEAPVHLKDDVPRVEDTEQGPLWFAEGKELGVFGGMGASFLAPKRGQSKQYDSMYDAGFYEGGPHPTTPELRLKDMQLDGVDGEVIYGILTAGLILKNPELTYFVYQSYNTWAADFMNSHPGRWAPLACIPNHDPQVAATELRRAAELGLKGADFAVAAATTPIYHKDWDVLWSVAAEYSMPISFHTTGYPGWDGLDESIPQEYRPQQRSISTALFQLQGAELLCGVLFSGICERFPNFKFVLGECGVTWIPYVIDRMDEQHERSYSLTYSLTPKEFWGRQGYTTYQHELHLANFIPLVGEDNVMWGSDYPHGDGVWPNSQRCIAEDLAGISEETRRKLTRNNAGKLYRFLN